MISADQGERRIQATDQRLQARGHPGHHRQLMYPDIFERFACSVRRGHQVHGEVALLDMRGAHPSYIADGSVPVLE